MNMCRLIRKLIINLRLPWTLYTLCKRFEPSCAGVSKVERCCHHVLQCTFLHRENWYAKAFTWCQPFQMASSSYHCWLSCRWTLDWWPNWDNRHVKVISQQDDGWVLKYRAHITQIISGGHLDGNKGIYSGWEDDLIYTLDRSSSESHFTYCFKGSEGLTLWYLDHATRCHKQSWTPTVPTIFYIMVKWEWP